MCIGCGVPGDAVGVAAAVERGEEEWVGEAIYAGGKLDGDVVVSVDLADGTLGALQGLEGLVGGAGGVVVSGGGRRR